MTLRIGTMHTLSLRTVHALPRLLIWCYVPRCFTMRDISNNKTLSGEHEQLTTRLYMNPIYVPRE